MADAALAFTVEDYQPGSPRFSDDWLALAFSDRHNGQLLYVPAWSAWLRWDGTRWLRDDVLSVFDMARALCRDMAQEAQAEDPKRGDDTAQAITGASTIAAVERLARSDPRHARRSDDFDADPWALNTPAGVVDLRTGGMRPHRRGDLFTKVAGTAPGERCPRWIRFLLQITHRDKELVRFLQRFIGYTLTGRLDEHAFVFLLGPGGNGKSVLLAVIAALLGDYATTAMADVFTVGRTEQHPTHLASLRGARMVMVTETEAGVPWAEARLKSLTGGDRISARVMRGDPFEFSPAFKLWIAGNHRPVLRNPDPAMRRRMHLVPLTYVPPVPDMDLLEALKAELPGILAWAIRGCLAWQDTRLEPPAVVQAATSEYFAEQDAIATWLEERCKRVPHARTSPSTLFGDWKRWATEHGEDAGTEKRFSGEMERHFAKLRSNGKRFFEGVQLLPSETGAYYG